MTNILDRKSSIVTLKNLQRFKISVGCYLDEDFVKERARSSENTLLLLTNKAEVLGMNKLFENTEALGLNVGDMNDLEELVEVNSSHPLQSFPFYNLRVLVISMCIELRYLFTFGVANTLSKLEHLEVYDCKNMEELIHTRDSEEEMITFPKLKYLYLCGLPHLLSLCDNVNIIELPELVELKLESVPSFTSIYPNKYETSSLLKEEVLLPKLERLHIDDMENLKEIWPCEFSTSKDVNVSLLREISVKGCDNLVNLFTCNPMSLLLNLEELTVKNCGSVEVLFDIDLDSIGEIGKGSSSSCLRSITVVGLGNLREVWRIKGEDDAHLVCGFQAVESIIISECKRFENVFTPITINFDLGALVEISITNHRENGSNQEEKQINIQSKEEMSQVSVSISSNVVHSFHNLRVLKLGRWGGEEAVFEIESPTSKESVTPHRNHQLLFYLTDLDIGCMETMRHVWKCNWNKFLILQKQRSESPFHNLTTINLEYCKSIKYLFSPLMAKLLSNLKKLRIKKCDGIEEVISNRDDEDEEMTTSTSSHTSTALFPCLDYILLHGLPNLKCIGGGWNNEMSSNNTTTISGSVNQFKFSQVAGVSWTLCQHSREIWISESDALSSLIPCYASGKLPKLQVLKIDTCCGMREVFETQGISSDEGKVGAKAISRLSNVVMLPNLKILEIKSCHLLEHIFTFSALESLKGLQELTIKECKAMKAIVKEEDDDGDQQTTTNNVSSSKEVVAFPRLKSVELFDLPELAGFFLGKNIEFQFPSLDKVTIMRCPKMMVFAPGGSAAPQLNYIHTSLGKHSLECGLNFHVTTPAASHRIPIFPTVDDGTSLYPATTSIERPWSFHNLIDLDVEFIYDVKKIIPSDELPQMQKLEKIHLRFCKLVEEIFKELEAGRNSSSSGFDDDSQATLVKLPNLRQVELEFLDNLRYIWKSNQWTLFEFPNLTRVHIHGCKMLEHVFTSSMVGSLMQLQELSILDCNNMKEVIVKDEYVTVVQAEEEEESKDGKMNEIIRLPCLKSLTLDTLPRLEGFCLLKEDFSFPLLDTLIIKECQAIMIFTKGKPATPHLQEIETRFGSYYVAGEDINSFIKAKQEEFERDIPWWRQS